VAYYSDTSGTFASKASANGALYATSANGTLQWGTLPVGQGGTGNTTGTATYATTTEDTTNALYPVGVTSGATTALKRDTSITMTGGAISATSFAASSYVAVNSGNSGTTGGLALYGTGPTSYGIAMRQTSNGGKHGYVQGDWATYFYMQGSNGTANDTYLTRGWVFRNNGYAEGVASISGHGNAVFRGSVTVGGNVTNTSGMRMEYDANLECTNFIFN